MKKVQLIKLGVLVILAVAYINMGGGGEIQNTTPEPHFTKLEDGQISLVATVYDKNIATKIYDICFSGKTNLGGVKRLVENNIDSVNLEFDFASIKELIIINPTFQGPDENTYILAKIISKEGFESTNLLFPPNIQFSGIYMPPATGKPTWYLKTIVSIAIEGQKNVIGGLTK